MEAISASDTLIPTCQTAHGHNTQDGNMKVHSRENLEYETETARSKERNVIGNKQWGQL
jgi:hypothetical protein